MSEQTSSSGTAKVRIIPAAETWPLRLAVLRPGRPIEAAQFPGDDADTTRHFGAFLEGKLLGIASLYLAPMTEQPGLSAFQLRGMATAPEARGMGFGRALVDACLVFTRENDAHLLWCNARVGAVGFYRKLGFEIVGGEFEIPDVGPHYRMWIAVR